MVAGWIAAVVRLPRRERSDVGRGRRRGPGDSRALPALRRVRINRRICRRASPASTCTRPTPGRWPSGPAVPFRSSSATTATWAASPKRSACAARAAATVLMLAPGSGLGCAFIDGRGLPLDGDTLPGMEAAPHAGAAAPARRQAVSRAAAAAPGAASRCTRRSAGLPYLLAESCRASGSRARQLRRRRRRSARSRCAAWPRRGTRWPSRSSISRRAPWACTSRSWRWRSTRSSSSSAAA